MLEMWNYRVIEAKNGIEALSLAAEICPDLILMSMKLPFLDGMNVTRQIRNLAEICDTCSSLQSYSPELAIIRLLNSH